MAYFLLQYLSRKSKKSEVGKRRPCYVTKMSRGTIQTSVPSLSSTVTTWRRWTSLPIHRTRPAYGAQGWRVCYTKAQKVNVISVTSSIIRNANTWDWFLIRKMKEEHQILVMFCKIVLQIMYLSSGLWNRVVLWLVAVPVGVIRWLC